jgi:hypothetical protein
MTTKTHTITVTINLATDVKLLAERAATELKDKIEAIELTVDGVTSHLHHSVTSVKVAAK